MAETDKNGKPSGEPSPAASHPSGLDLSNLSPEEQKLFDAAFAKGAQKVEGDRDALKEQLGKTQKLLETTKTNASLSEQEKASLQEQVESIKATLQTKEQTLTEQLNELRQTSQKAVTDLRAESESWERRHHRNLVDQALTKAAVENDAFNTEQVVRLLYEDCQVVEVKDEKTQQVEGHKVQMRLNVEEDGKFVTKTFDPMEGVRHYLANNPNLLKSAVTSGGMGTGALRGVQTPAGLLTQAEIEDPNNYDTPEKAQAMMEKVADGQVVREA